MTISDKVAIWGLAVGLLALAVSIVTAMFVYLRSQHPAVKVVSVKDELGPEWDEGIAVELLNCGAPAYDVSVCLAVKSDDVSVKTYFHFDAGDGVEYSKLPVLERGQQASFWIGPAVLGKYRKPLIGKSDEELSEILTLSIFGSGRCLKRIPRFQKRFACPLARVFAVPLPAKLAS